MNCSRLFFILVFILLVLYYNHSFSNRFTKIKISNSVEVKNIENIGDTSVLTKNQLDSIKNGNNNNNASKAEASKKYGTLKKRYVDENGVAFHVFILGYKRYKSLKRLLTSLDKADWLGDKIYLHVKIDGGSGSQWEKSIQVAKNHEWKFGPKEVVVREKNGGLAAAWLTAWYPKNDYERAIILEDDLAVSPVFYRWFTMMHQKYDNRPEIGAYTTQRQALVATNGGRRTFKQVDSFGYKLLGSWGFFPSAKHWREFIKLDFNKLKPQVKGLITTKWFNRQKRGKMWTQYWIWFCEKYNLYNIYVSPPNRKAMASNYRERGVHYGKTKGADFKVLNEDEWVSAWDSPPDVLKLLGWNARPHGKSYPPEWSEEQISQYLKEEAIKKSQENEEKIAEVPEETVILSIEDFQTVQHHHTPKFINESKVKEISENQVDILVQNQLQDLEKKRERRIEENKKIERINKLKKQEEISLNINQTLEIKEFSSAIEDPKADDEVDESDAPQNLTLADIEQMESMMDSKDIVNKAKIVEKEGLMYLQLLNEGFVEITKSWICNVKDLPRVLDRTLFVCTDVECYKQLKRFVQTQNIELHIHLQVHKSEKVLRYGQMSYYEFILFRATLLESLLRNGISLFLVESDAIWYGDITKYFLDELDPALDAVIMHNDYFAKGHGMNGGFLWLKSRPIIIDVVRKLYKIFSTKLKKLKQSYKNGKDYVGAKGNEQGWFRQLIYQESVNSKANKILKHMVPLDKFAGGLWYQRNHRMDSLNPHVILNNWVRGNNVKKHRAIKWGQWFLERSEETCKTHNEGKRPISAADSALFSSSAKWNFNNMIKVANTRLSFLWEKINEKAIFVIIATSENLELTKNWICFSQKHAQILDNVLIVPATLKIFTQLEAFSALSGFSLPGLIQPPGQVSLKTMNMFTRGVIYKLVKEGFNVVQIKPNTAIFKNPFNGVLGKVPNVNGDVYIPSGAKGRVENSAVVIYRPTEMTYEFLVKYIVGCAKNLYTSDSGSPPLQKITGTKLLNTIKFEMPSTGNIFSSSDNTWIRFSVNSDDPDHSIKQQVEAYKLWALAKDNKTCKSNF